jgi:hypothetical protein
MTAANLVIILWITITAQVHWDPMMDLKTGSIPEEDPMVFISHVIRTSMKKQKQKILSVVLVTRALPAEVVGQEV